MTREIERLWRLHSTDGLRDVLLSSSLSDDMRAKIQTEIRRRDLDESLSREQCNIDFKEAAYEQRLIDEATASERERWLPLLVAAKEVLAMHIEEVFYDPRFADLRKAVEQLDK